MPRTVWNLGGKGMLLTGRLWRWTVGLCWLILLFSQMQLQAEALAVIPDAPIPGKSWVVDRAEIFSKEQLVSLNEQLRYFEQSKKVVLTVLTTPNLSGMAVEEFGIKVADKWKIGDKSRDDGVILILAKDERKIRIEVGYGLEGTLTDAISRRIIDQVIVPKILQSSMAEGLLEGVNAITTFLIMGELPAQMANSDQNQDISTASKSDIDEPTGLEVPKEYHTVAATGLVVVLLLIGLSGLFNSTVSMLSVGFVIVGFGGFLSAMMFGGRLSFVVPCVVLVLYAIMRLVIQQTKYGKKMILSAASAVDHDADSSSTSSSSSTSTSSDDDSSSSRGGGFGGGGASGSF
ncbi:MAG: TPM domain-containing protein [Proteobacteria bacterium]|nr:TPM domain-containing protein [Pseudomonadota bacterium]